MAPQIFTPENIAVLALEIVPLVEKLQQPDMVMSDYTALVPELLDIKIIMTVLVVCILPLVASLAACIYCCPVSCFCISGTA